jgi:hypothetical protein
MTVRIAMWSGPRNISTAMMRCWENRPDTQVVDEPFYAYYLANTTTPHPMQEAVLASQANDWQTVARQLSSDPMDSPVFYQKHMTHHMLPDIDLSWTKDLVHCFLIRDPALVVNSYVKKMDQVTSDDIGIQRQFELYQQLTDITGQDIPIVEGADILRNPKVMLKALCARLGVPFYEDMLHWPAGRRDSDGVWAPHWYHAVEASTGFEPYQEPQVSLTPDQQSVADENQPYYQAMAAKRLVL